MENRFGLKDFILIILLLAVIGVLFLSMKQKDRDREVLLRLEKSLSQQTATLAEVSRTIGRIQFSAGSTTMPSLQADNVPQVFQRIVAAQKMPDYAPGDWFVDTIGNTEKLTPLASSDVYASDVQSKVLESLATRDAVTLEWIPLLAESWTVSSDGLSIAFKVRPGVVFSDGERMTADDVVFTFNWVMNEKVDAPRERAYYNKISSVEKTGDMEVVFKAKEPYFKFFELAGGMQILPEHFYSKYTPEQFNQAPGLLMGTGQYRMADPASWTPGQAIQLPRNERYWGVPAAFDRLVYKNVDSDLARSTAIRNADVDALFNLQPDVYLDLKNDAKLMEHCRAYAYDSPFSGYRYIGWNQSREGKPTRFADKRVRQAMTMMTNRERMITDLISGLGTIATGPFSPQSKQHDPAVKPWPYDIAQAKKLLAEAGYIDRNNDGIVESADGVPFRFKLIYPSGIGNYQQMALDLKDSYAQAGVALEPDPQDWSIFSQRLKTREFEAITLGWSTSIEGDLYQVFHSSQIQNAGDNAMSYNNPELDKLIDEARKTMDEDKRMAMWHRAEAILYEDQPYTFLFYRKELVVMDSRIQNVQMLKLGLNPYEEWYSPAGKWKWVK
jgi:peptide/nickel transport system substrate-binding protein